MVYRTIEDAKRLAKEKGGKCLSSLYIQSNLKLKWQCKEGHEWESPLNSIIRGTWCNVCHLKNKNLYSKEKLMNIIKEKGGVCLSSYINSQIKIKVKCKEGHEWNANITHLRRYGCQKCSGKFKGWNGWRKKKLNFETIKQKAREMGGECISKEYEYKGSNHKLRWRCKEGHEWNAKYNNVQYSHWCPECAGVINSRLEKECRRIFEELFKVPFKKVRPNWLKYKKKRPLELDGLNETIVTPIGLGLAFETNGKERKKYDKFKMKKCKKKGVLVIIIPYTVGFSKLRDYIIKELEKNGVLLNSIKIQRNLTEYK
jgi:hypothetical protein